MERQDALLCNFYNHETSYCGSFLRRRNDMRYAMDTMGRNAPIICDYNKNCESMRYCPYYERRNIDKG